MVHIDSSVLRMEQKVLSPESLESEFTLSSHPSLVTETGRRSWETPWRLGAGWKPNCHRPAGSCPPSLRCFNSGPARQRRELQAPREENHWRGAPAIQVSGAALQLTEGRPGSHSPWRFLGSRGGVTGHLISPMEVSRQGDVRGGGEWRVPGIFKYLILAVNT